MSRTSNEGSMAIIRDTFRKEFSRFSLTLPEENLQGRTPGSLPYGGGGRLFFVFGREDGREYLEYYGHHRMGDCHGKISDNGQHVILPELCSSYGYNPDIPGDEEKKRAEMEREYRELLEDLERKGLLDAGPVPVSMAMNAHLVLKPEGLDE